MTDKLLMKHPVLTYSVYCRLKDLGISNMDIGKTYGVDLRALSFFVKNHYKVLGKLEVY